MCKKNKELKFHLDLGEPEEEAATGQDGFSVIRRFEVRSGFKILHDSL